VKKSLWRKKAILWLWKTKKQQTFLSTRKIGLRSGIFRLFHKFFLYDYYYEKIR